MFKVYLLLVVQFLVKGIGTTAEGLLQSNHIQQNFKYTA